MNKYLLAIALFSQVTLITHAAVQAPSATTTASTFEKLAPKIVQLATLWSKTITQTLPEELQLAHLNLFVPRSQTELTECVKYIQSQIEKLTTIEELSENMNDIINTYVESIYEKLQKKTLTKQDEEKAMKKLQTKVQELLGYIHDTYYRTLYATMAKKSPSNLKYMFDDKGMIAKGKRTEALPQPE